MRRHWILLVALLGVALVPLIVPVAHAAMADMEEPFSETGEIIWGVVIPVASVLLVIFGTWLALRGGHGGIFLAFVGGLMLLYFIGALPEIAQDAGLEWPL